VAGQRARGAQGSARAHSQHFLRSSTLARAIVADARLRGDELVLDIGAGTGRLTAELASRAAAVRAIELDPVLAARLRKRFRGVQNVAVVEADALRLRLPGRPFRVVANLPFAHTTAILRRLLDPVAPLERADVIVAWDLARKRAACWPSTLAGVCWGVRFELVLARRLPAACFEPKPAVDAGLLQIVRRQVPLVAPADYDRFCAFVGAGFTSGSLAPLARGRSLNRAARELGVRRGDGPRDLDVHQWAALFAATRT
jgi:23S rRNA (adenine-N6)-dimethyltransferase